MKTNKKKILIFLILLSLMFLTFSYLTFRDYKIIVLEIVTFFIIVDIFTIFFYKIYLINIFRVIYFFKSFFIRKKISKNEKYLQKISIDTFDGSGSLTHPSLLYFENGYKGYKYWLAFTPYDNNSVDLEIPSIRVSNDGINFSKITNGLDPILEYIPKQYPSKYYSDPFLFYDDGKIELWYRLCIEDKKLNRLEEYIYVTSTQNGCEWSTPLLVLNNITSCLSLSIVKINNIYIMYFFTTDYRMYTMESNDKINWYNKKEVIVKGFQGKFWHGEVKKYNNELILLFMTRDYKLYKSKGRINKYSEFSELEEIKAYFYSQDFIYGNEHLYKSTFEYINNKLYLYIPFRIDKINIIDLKNIRRGKWYLTFFKLNKNSEKLIKKIK